MSDHPYVPLRVGDILTDRENAGFCGGSFGRDSYGDKTIVGIGADWVVARQEDGTPVMYAGDPEYLGRFR